MIFKNFFAIIVLFLVSIEHELEAFNFFSEIFNDLRIGSLDKDYLIQKLDNSKLKCLQGSYFFNGSCYIISNKKYRDKSSFFETDDISEFLIKRGQKLKNAVSSALAASDLTMSVFRLPDEAAWNSSFISCSTLNNDSSLIYFNNEYEYEYLLKLLKGLNLIF